MDNLHQSIEPSGCWIQDPGRRIEEFYPLFKRMSAAKHRSSFQFLVSSILSLKPKIHNLGKHWITERHFDIWYNHYKC